MIFYFILLLLLLLLSIRNFKNRLLKYISIFLLSLIAGLRVNLGADYESYFTIFNNINFNDLFSNEPLFIILIFIIKSFNLNFHFFLFLNTFLSLIAIYKSLNLFNVKNYWFSILIYFCLFYFQFQFNVLRHGVMASFIWFGYGLLINHKYKKTGYLSLLIGAFYQYLGILFIPLFYLLNFSFSRLYTVIIILISIFCFYVNISDLILNIFYILPFLGSKIKFYVNEYDSVGYGFTLGMLFNFLFFLVLRFKFFKNEYLVENKIKFLVNALFFSFSISLIFNRYNVFVERIASVLNMSLIFLIPFFYEKIILKSRNYENRVIFYIFFILYLLLVLNQILNTPMPSNRYIMQFTPYKSIL